MIRLYRKTTFGGIPDQPEQELATGELGAENLQEANDRIRLHWRIERNKKLTSMAKKLQGSKCRACGFDYSTKYGGIGRGYIEAHHNIPLSELPRDRAIALDPRQDFTVLCANCHRMVHRRPPLLTLSELKELLASQGEPDVIG